MPEQHTPSKWAQPQPGLVTHEYSVVMLEQLLHARLSVVSGVYAGELPILSGTYDVV